MENAAIIPTLIRLLKRGKPTSVYQTRALGIKMHNIGNGAFRDAYKVKDVPLVIKFPFCSCDDSDSQGQCSHYCASPQHSRQEVKVYKKIMKDKRYRALRGFMPKIYYFDSKTGIVAVHYYKSLKNNAANYYISELIDQFIQQTLNIKNTVDMRHDNIGFETNDDNTTSFKIFDLGCIKHD